MDSRLFGFRISFIITNSIQDLTLLQSSSSGFCMKDATDRLIKMIVEEVEENGDGGFMTP
uniref:Uncharacterized protein n=1 Tax=Helianthus annuus TaxID=4232 RepID=A0A251UMG2_HELAN